VDGEGRPYTATQGTHNFVTAATYNAGGRPLTLSLYNNDGDNDSYTYDPNTGRMTNYTFTVGATPKSMSGTLTWNANGSLSKLAVTDGFNAGGTETCKYGDPTASVAGYDDLGRIINANCGTPWSQSFSYDPFGNITKSGSITWMPGYNQSTNRYTLGGTVYDSNGNLLNDSFHSYVWDANNHPVTITSPNGSTTCSTAGVTCLTYDAMNRMVEKNVAGTFSEIEYSPIGKVAVMNGATQAQGYVPLPGGLVLSPSPVDTFWHTDWLGSARLASSASQRTITYDRAFAPFGEAYATVTGGTSNLDFTGLTQDTISDEYDTVNREQHPNQGRWISPDPAGLGATDVASPQSWNRYAYVKNNPLLLTDPTGLDGLDGPGGGGPGGFDVGAGLWGSACSFDLSLCGGGDNLDPGSNPDEPLAYHWVPGPKGKPPIVVGDYDGEVMCDAKGCHVWHGTYGKGYWEDAPVSDPRVVAARKEWHPCDNGNHWCNDEGQIEQPFGPACSVVTAWAASDSNLGDKDIDAGLAAGGIALRYPITAPVLAPIATLGGATGLVLKVASKVESAAGYVGGCH
jgi:RHS repeat-associated protein